MGQSLTVVYGGNGFLGRHLVQRLHQMARPAVVVSRNPDPAFLAKHAPSVRSMSSTEFETEQGTRLLKTAAHFVYLASLSIPATFASEPWQELPVNVEPGFRTFHRLADCSEAQVIFLSSGGTVYGSGHTTPIPEEAPLRPISPHALHKIMLENALGFLARTAGLRYQILRVSNPIGRWQSSPHHGFVQVVLRKMLNSEEVNVFGDGRQIRDYVDADDVAEAMVLAMDSPRLESDVYNVGSGRGHSLLQILDVIETVTGAPPSVRLCDPRSVDVSYSVLDCGKIREAIGWTASASVEQSIERVWQGLQEETAPAQPSIRQLSKSSFRD